MLDRFERFDFTGEFVRVAVSAEGVDHEDPRFRERLELGQSRREKLQFESFLASASAPHIRTILAIMRERVHDNAIRLNRAVKF
jgi:hypothetical protein